jgi:hypothetical protein
MPALQKSIEHVTLTLSAGTNPASVNLTKGQDPAACTPFYSIREAGAAVAAVNGNILPEVWFDDNAGTARVNAQLLNGDDVQVEIAVIEWDLTKVNVQQGTYTIGSGAVESTAAISAVDQSKAFIIHSERMATTSGFWFDRACHSARFTSDTEITFSRFLSSTIQTTTGRFYVVECIGTEFTVQSVGLANDASTQGTTTFNLAISAVDMAKTFIVGGYAAGNNDDDPVDGAMWWALTSTTNVQYQRLGGGTPASHFMNVRFFAVTCANDEWTVQRAQPTIGSGETADDTTISAIDQARSVINPGSNMSLTMGHANTTNGVNVPGLLLGFTFAADTTVRASRRVTGSLASAYAFEVVQFADPSATTDAEGAASGAAAATGVGASTAAVPGQASGAGAAAGVGASIAAATGVAAGVGAAAGAGDTAADVFKIYWEVIGYQDGIPLDQHVGELGATWAEHPESTGAPITVHDNTARKHRGPQDAGLFIASGTPPTADYEVIADIIASADPTNGTLGVVARCDPTANTYYRFVYDDPTGRWKLFKVVAGTEEQIGTETFNRIGTAETREIKLRVEGTTITGYRDGVSQAVATDSDISAAGKAGLWIGGWQSVFTMDNFVARELDTTAFVSDTFTEADTPARPSEAELTALDIDQIEVVYGHATIPTDPLDMDEGAINAFGAELEALGLPVSIDNENAAYTAAYKVQWAQWLRDGGYTGWLSYYSSPLAFIRIDDWINGVGSADWDTWQAENDDWGTSGIDAVVNGISEHPYLSSEDHVGNFRPYKEVFREYTGDLIYERYRVLPTLEWIPYLRFQYVAGSLNGQICSEADWRLQLASVYRQYQEGVRANGLIVWHTSDEAWSTALDDEGWYDVLLEFIADPAAFTADVLGPIVSNWDNPAINLLANPQWQNRTGDLPASWNAPSGFPGASWDDGPGSYAILTDTVSSQRSYLNQQVNSLVASDPYTYYIYIHDVNTLTGRFAAVINVTGDGSVLSNAAGFTGPGWYAVGVVPDNTFEQVRAGPGVDGNQTGDVTLSRPCLRAGFVAGITAAGQRVGPLATEPGVEISIAAATGAAAGAGQAAGIGAATAAAAGIAAGTGAASGAGETAGTIAAGAGTAGGTGTASGIGAAISAGAGIAAGAGQAAAVGAAHAAAAGTASGAGQAVGVGAPVAAGAGTASGAGQATGIGGGHAAAAGVAAGTGAATAAGDTAESGIESGAGTAGGTGTAAGHGASIAAAVGVGAGAGQAAAVGAGHAAAAGAASATGQAAGVGAPVAAGAGAAAAAGQAAGVGAATAAAAGIAAGTGAASGAGDTAESGIESGAGTAGGTGTAAGLGASIAAATGVAAGTGAAAGAGRSTAAAVGAGAAAGNVVAIGAGVAHAAGLATGAGTAAGLGAGIAAAAGVAAAAAAAAGAGSTAEAQIPGHAAAGDGGATADTTSTGPGATAGCTGPAALAA